MGAMTTPSFRSDRGAGILVLGLLAACGSADVDTAAEVADGDARGSLQFRLPLLETHLFELVVGVDHDPVDHSDGPMAEALLCTAYDGRPFPACYDEHRGSDYILEGAFDTMDAGSATILAAAGGTVIDLADGNYDRCHKASDGVDCDGNPGDPNYVIVAHEGGWQTKYWHMQNGSVAVAVGDDVACGDPLGKVGSSGYSSQPHLHFQLEDEEGVAIDPYAGEYSQAETWWVEQRASSQLPVDRCEE